MNAPWHGSNNGQPPPPQQQQQQPQQQGPQVQSNVRNFISIGDFMRQQEAQDPIGAAHFKAIAAATLAHCRPPKKMVKKNHVDPAAAAAEASAVAELGEVNWTGRLGEYRAAHPTSAAVKGLEYFEAPGSFGKFTCTVKLMECPQPFGDPRLSFTVKKQARQYASKKAIDWLIATDHMPADGSAKFPKTKTPESNNIIGPKIPTGTPSSAPTRPAKGPTVAGKIPDLCLKLGFGLPAYKIERVSENAPLYRGYAHFPGEARIQGKIGELQNDVHGQKNAKEVIAVELLSFLQDIERQRNEAYEDEDRKRKRDDEGEEGVPPKVAKVEAPSKMNGGDEVSTMPLRLATPAKDGGEEAAKPVEVENAPKPAEVEDAPAKDGGAESLI